MKWSLKLGKLLGIDVCLHFTFLLLLALPVLAGGRIVGLLTLENISEMIKIHSAMDHQGAGHSLMAKPTANIFAAP